MKTINIRILLIVVFLGLLQTVSAQIENNDIIYGYDDAGNRTDRSIDISKVLKPDSLQKGDIFNYIANTEMVTSNTAQDLNETIGNKQITIYPNPTDGILKINITNLDIKDKGSIKLYGVNGAELIYVKNIQASNTINISDKPNGAYMMKVLLNGKETVWKVMKK
jgi:hypothetical protein